MSLALVILLGIIQGLTEFFPVSSSGHLVLFQNLFGLHEPQILADVILHVGTLLSLFVFLRKELGDILRSIWLFCLNPKKNLSDPNIRLVLALIVASIPAVLAGYFFSAFFESLFSSLLAVGVSLLATGGFLFLTKFARERKVDWLTHPLIIGILQAAAIVPGFSRSGLTIGGALLLGWRRTDAARFSFLLSIPAILGASLYQLNRVQTVSPSWGILLPGALAAAVSGYLALVFLMALINRRKFHSFSVYVIFAGIVALIASFVV